MDNNCVRCGRKVRPEENWVKVHLWASNAVFDWGCFIALLKSTARRLRNRRLGRVTATRRRRQRRSVMVSEVQLSR